MSGWHMYQHRNDKWILGDTRIRWKHPFYPYACWAQCTNNHSIHSDPSIKSDRGQNSQFLQCFFPHISVWELTSGHDLHEKTLMNNYLWCKCHTQRLSNCVFGLECFVSALFMQLVSRHTFTFLMPSQLISPSIHHTFSFASLLIRCNSIFCTAPCELVGWTIYFSK